MKLACEALPKLFLVFTCFVHLLHCITLLAPLTLHACLSVTLCSPFGEIMLQLLTLICLFPQSGISESRDDGIKSFLKRDDKAMVATEAYLWNNPNRVVTFNDIMIDFKKQYGLD